jgi:hypothetical protein
MWRSAFSGEVSIIVSINIVMSANSILVYLSSTCSRCVPRCYLIASSTDVEGAIPFKVSWVATLEALVLRMGVILAISSTMRVVRLSRWTRKRGGGSHDLNSLRFPNLLTKVGSSDDSNMALDFLMDH